MSCSSYVSAWAIAAVVPIGLTLGAGSAAAQMTERVSLASDGTESNDGSDRSGAVSDDGRLVAFESSASNLVDDDTNDELDVFVRDRMTGQTVPVSVSSDGEEGDSASGLGGVWMSGNGRYVLFKSHATNLVHGDTNGERDIFVHDLETGRTVRVSVSSEGEQADRQCGVAPGSEGISRDGRFVVFNTSSTNLVPNDENGLLDVFVHDRDADGSGVFDETCDGCRKTTRVSLSTHGGESNVSSFWPALSSDARFVSFGSSSPDLVCGDTNDDRDVFVRDRSLRMTGDVNGDGLVDFGDLLDLLSQWGPCVDCTADLDGDCLVAFDDLLALLSNWS